MKNINLYDIEEEEHYRKPKLRKPHKKIVPTERLSDKDRIAWQAIRLFVFKRDNWTCKYCGRRRNKGQMLRADHVIPISKGGSDNVSNLVTACIKCDTAKGNMMPVDFLTILTR